LATKSFRYLKPSSGVMLVPLVLALLAFVAVVVMPHEPTLVALARSTVDRPDDGSPYKVHLVYVLPHGKSDGRLDTNGTLAKSVRLMEKWFDAQTSGSHLRFDRWKGQLDVSFLALKQDDASLSRLKHALVGEIQRRGIEAGFHDPRKVYVYIYDGGAKVAPVAGSATNGAAAVYLDACQSNGQRWGGLSCAEAVLLHETLHALGFVQPDAPHWKKGEHVYNDTSDLMFEAIEDEDGTELEHGLVLDPEHVEYFGHGRSNRLDLARSLYLEPTPEDFQISFGRPIAIHPGLHARKIRTLAVRGEDDPAPAFEIKSASLGEGPLHTYTLAIQLALAKGLGATFASVVRDEQDPSYLERVSPGVTTPFYVSIPRSGRHTVQVVTSHTGFKRKVLEEYALNLTIDGGLPLARAVDLP
jgi:hypothetical protein